MRISSRGTSPSDAYQRFLVDDNLASDDLLNLLGLEASLDFRLFAW